MSEKFTEDCLSWEEPHGIAEEIPLKPTKKSKKPTKTPMPCVLALSVERREGLEGKNGFLKVYFSFHCPLLILLIILFLYTFKFDPALPLVFSPNP